MLLRNLLDEQRISLKKIALPSIECLNLGLIPLIITTLAYPRLQNVNYIYILEHINLQEFKVCVNL